jgi:predicted NBD/HSP70 family sugar kinase
MATPSASPAEVVARVVQRATAVLAESPDRSVLSAGLVAPWGDIEHDRTELTARMEKATGLPVATAHHVAAVVAAEYLARRHGTGGCTAYLYARDTAGFALATDHPEGTEISRVAALTHFPTRCDIVCACGRTGCLEAVASNDALARRAHDDRVIDRPEIEALHSAAAAGSRRAHRMLCDRARVLGAAAAVLRDMVAPDRVVLVGQAFTGYPPALDDVVAAFEETPARSPVELSFTRFGTGVQAAAAGTVALGPVYEAPLVSVGRVTRLDRALARMPG